MGTRFDLLGDEIPEGFGRRGRPPHRVTDEKRKLVIQLVAFDWARPDIAAALSISEPTLRKNYFRELVPMDQAKARLKAVLLSALMAEVEKGNVSAIAAYFKRIDRADAGIPVKKVPMLGKKDQARARAAVVPSSWSELVKH